LFSDTSNEEFGDAPEDLIDFARYAVGDVRRAMFAAAPCISLDELDLDDHPYNEHELVTQLDVRRFVAMLQPVDRDIVNLIYWEDVAAVDVAHMKGISASAVSQRLARVYRLGKAYFAEVQVAA
jgi:DNA-directed RNA polymerase specialized sigma24 family protein